MVSSCPALKPRPGAAALVVGVVTGPAGAHTSALQQAIDQQLASFPGGTNEVSYDNGSATVVFPDSTGVVPTDQTPSPAPRCQRAPGRAVFAADVRLRSGTGAGGRRPRRAEASAPTSAIAAAAVNTVTRPSCTEPDTSSGKNVRPVSTWMLCCGNPFSAPVPAQHVLDRVVAEERREQGAHRRQRRDIGRGVRTHALALEAGGEGVRERAGQAGDHQREEMPMDSDEPEFWNVERIPDATPRSAAGTLPMIAEVFGVENMPCPMPDSTSRPANSG